MLTSKDLKKLCDMCSFFRDISDRTEEQKYYQELLLKLFNEKKELDKIKKSNWPYSNKIKEEK